MELGKRIALRMKELGLTQIQLASRTGLTQQAISQYIRGQFKPGYDTIITLSKGLEVEPPWFFSDEEVEDSSSQEPLSRPMVTIHTVPNPTSTDVVVFPTSGQVKRDTTFTIGHWFPMRQFPAPSQVTPNSLISNFYALIFNKLAHLVPPKQIRGALAVDWKPMGKSWIFQLREGVRFHNGERLTAEDVSWSYQRYLEQNPQERFIEGVEVIDPRFVKIHLKTECRFEEIAMPVIQPARTRRSESEFLGTGPFQVIELKPGFWRLRRNADYFWGSPFFREVYIREYPHEEALSAALVSGEVDFAVGLDYPHKGYIVTTEPTVQRYHLHFMFDKPLVQNERVRRAIAYGLDIRELAFAAGLSSPLYSAGAFDYTLDDRLQVPPSFDKETAMQLLANVEAIQDSVFRVKHYETIPQSRVLAEKIVEQLNEIGIRAEIGEDAHAILVTRPMERLEREFAIWKTSSRHNINHYTNPKVDALIERCLSDGATTTRLLELRQLIQKDVPDVLLFYYEMPITYVNRLRALENHVILLGILNEIHTWYLEEASEEEKATIASSPA